MHNRGYNRDIFTKGNLLTLVEQRWKAVGFKRDILWKIFIRLSPENLTLFGFLSKTKHY
uniref:Uncharacterized protein n=1 Tax=Candidatus Methanophaga sp. ANME-1 ERB7 TaxID=2759913 RepID=A0A7G9Z991_9EURY|nr:hypothetical protein IPLBMFHP_00011 [Methanosarcinales archaeon ANME-1 ERB7]